MKKKKKIIVIAAILAVILAVGVSVSIYLYINRFDAGEYVQAVLDTSYKNETDQYVEITGISQEEAEKIFDDNLEKQRRYSTTIWTLRWRDLRTRKCRRTCSRNTESFSERLPEKSAIR